MLSSTHRVYTTLHAAFGAATIVLCSIACSGGSTNQREAASVLPAVNQRVATPAAPTSPTIPVMVQVKYAISHAETGAAGAVAPNALARRAEYISPSNTNLTIVATTADGVATTYGPTACTTASCAVNFTALPGPTTLTFNLTDASNNLLSSTSTLVIIAPSTLNTFNFTANPVVSSVTASLASAMVNAGTATDVALTVNALDADGNTIIGNTNYVDTTGNPVALLLSVTNNQQGGHGSVTIKGPQRITAPAQAAVYAHYDGNWLASSTITVATTSAAITSTATTILTTNPYVKEYKVAGSPWGITSGPDGKLWFTENSANAIGVIATNGSAFTTFPCSFCNGPRIIVPAIDGNLWFSEFAGHDVAKITTSGQATSVYNTGSSIPSIVAGPDGSIWSDVNKRIFLNGKVQTISAGGRAIADSPDGNVWILNQASSLISVVASNGKLLATYTLSGFSAAGRSDGMVAGPDGNMWFVDYTGNHVESMTLSGVPVVTVNLQANANPDAIVIGPDGNLWVAESGAGAVARITPSGALQEYGTSAGITNGASVYGITAGSDGNLWITENNKNIVAKFIL